MSDELGWLGDFGDPDPQQGTPIAPPPADDDPFGMLKGFKPAPVAPARQAAPKVPADFEAMVRAEAERQGVDPDFAIRVYKQEGSRGNARARSPKGAIGLMQIMPETGRELGLSVNELFDPEKNIRAGIAYLRKQLMTYGSKTLGAAAYNAGPGRVQEYGGVPPFTETQQYTANVNNAVGDDPFGMLPDAKVLPASPQPTPATTATTPVPAPIKPRQAQAAQAAPMWYQQQPPEQYGPPDLTQAAAGPPDILAARGNLGDEAALYQQFKVHRDTGNKTGMEQTARKLKILGWEANAGSDGWWYVKPPRLAPDPLSGAPGFTGDDPEAYLAQYRWAQRGARQRAANIAQRGDPDEQRRNIERLRTLPPREKALAARQIAAVRDITPEEYDVLDLGKPGAHPYETAAKRIQQAAADISAGASGVLGDIGVYAGNILPEWMGARFLRGTGEERKLSSELLSRIEGLRPGLAKEVAHGIGTSVPFMAVGGIPGATGKVAVALFGWATEAGAAYDEARHAGKSHEEAMKAAHFTGPAGVLEIFGLGGTLGRVGRAKALRELIAAGLREAGEEASQEMIQQVYENFVAKGFYDPDRAVLHGVGRAGVVAGLTGGIMGGGTHVAGKALGKAITGEKGEQYAETIPTNQRITSEVQPEDVGEGGQVRGGAEIRGAGEEQGRAVRAGEGAQAPEVSVEPSLEEYTEQAVKNLQATSRTIKGVLNTAAQPGKEDLFEDVSGDQAAKLAERNVRDATEFAYENRDREFESPEDLLNFADDLARINNQDILKEDAPLLRKLDSEKHPYTKVADLPKAREQFATELLDRLESGEDPKETAAWIEWRANYTDHFWADATGRTSRQLAEWVLMRAGEKLPNAVPMPKVAVAARRAGESGESYLGPDYEKFRSEYMKGFEEADRPVERPKETIKTKAKEQIESEEFYKEHPYQKISPGLSIVSQAKELEALPDDHEVWVFHATDEATAEQFTKEGITASTKPSNLARQRFEKGEYAEYAPGRGLASGLTVGLTPAGVSGMGRQLIAIKVRKGDVKISPEQAGLGVTSPSHALAADDAYIDRDVKPEEVHLVGEPGRYPKDVYTVLATAGVLTKEQPKGTIHEQKPVSRLLRPEPTAGPEETAEAATKGQVSKTAGKREAEAEQKEQIINAFHGTREKGVTISTLEARDPGYSGSLGKGIYLGQNRETAEYYGPNVVQVQARVQNPLIIDPENPLQTINGKLQPRLQVFDETEEGLPVDSILPGESLSPFDVYSAKGEKYEVRDSFDLRGLRNWAEGQGHDAIIMRNMRPGGNAEELLVFDRSQIVIPEVKERVAKQPVAATTATADQTRRAARAILNRGEGPVTPESMAEELGKPEKPAVKVSRPRNQKDVVAALKEHFNYSDKAAADSAAITDALVTTLAKVSGESKESFYSHIVITKAGPQLEQAGLTQQQMKQLSLFTQTEAFKKFFGRSVVVDENDDPQILYHETLDTDEPSIEQEGFDINRPQSRSTDPGTPDGVFLKPHSQSIGIISPVDRAVQVPLYARIENPLHVQDREELNEWAADDLQYKRLLKSTEDYNKRKQVEWSIMLLNETENRVERDKWGNEIPVDHRTEQMDFMQEWEEGVSSRAMEARARLTQLIKDAGHDGVIIEVDQGITDVKTYIVLDPKQVKHATKNVGTYSLTEPSILKQEGFHGSPYEFDRFSMDKVGTGDKRAEFGYGLYFGGQKAVAQYFRDITTARRRWLYRGQDVTTGANRQLATAIQKILPPKSSETPAQTIQRSIQKLTAPGIFGRQADTESRAAAQTLAEIDPSVLTWGSPRGRLYKVDLKPAETDYLLWDESLDNQSDKVMAAVQQIVQQYPKLAKALTSDQSGKSIYQALAKQAGGPQAASRALLGAGIRGNKYLDAASRGEKEERYRSYNYVLFSDADIEITGLEQIGQAAMTGPRGITTFTRAGEAIIHAAENADQSTAIHEMHHALIPMFMEIATREGADSQFVKDMNDMAHWMGIKNAATFVDLHRRYVAGELSKAEEIRYRNGQERGAKGFEKYLRTGKAPTPELAGAFARFKRWLSEIYKNLDEALRGRISQRQRAIWDRMLGKETVEPSADIPLTIPRISSITDAETRQLIAGLRVAARNMAGLTREQQRIQRQTTRAALSDPEGHIARYKEMFPDNVIDTDRYKEIFPEYVRDRGKFASAVHEASSWLAKVDLYQRIANLPDNAQVSIRAGGPASGKTTSIQKMKGEDTADLVYDTTFSQRRGNGYVIQRIRNSAPDAVITITYVHRPVGLAQEGALLRAMPTKEGDVARRPVPEDYLGRSHYRTQHAFLQTYEDWKRDSAVTFEVIDNSGDFNPKIASVDFLRQNLYTSEEEAINEVRQTTERIRAEGFPDGRPLPDALYQEVTRGRRGPAATGETGREEGRGSGPTVDTGSKEQAPGRAAAATAQEPRLVTVPPQVIHYTAATKRQLFPGGFSAVRNERVRGTRTAPLGTIFTTTTESEPAGRSYGPRTVRLIPNADARIVDLTKPNPWSEVIAEEESTQAIKDAGYDGYYFIDPQIRRPAIAWFYPQRLQAVGAKEGIYHTGTDTVVPPKTITEARKLGRWVRYNRILSKLADENGVHVARLDLQPGGIRPAVGFWGDSPDNVSLDTTVRAVLTGDPKAVQYVMAKAAQLADQRATFSWRKNPKGTSIVTHVQLPAMSDLQVAKLIDVLQNHGIEGGTISPHELVIVDIDGSQLESLHDAMVDFKNQTGLKTYEAVQYNADATLLDQKAYEKVINDYETAKVNRRDVPRRVAGGERAAAQGTRLQQGRGEDVRELRPADTQAANRRRLVEETGPVVFSPKAKQALNNLQSVTEKYIREQQARVKFDSLALANHLADHHSSDIDTVLAEVKDREAVRLRPAIKLYDAGPNQPNVWLLVWRPHEGARFEAEGTPVHGHGPSSAGIRVYQGTVTEHLYTGVKGGPAKAGQPVTVQERALEEGAGYNIGVPYVHDFVNTGTEFAATVHVYNPALYKMEMYRVEMDGTLTLTGTWEEGKDQPHPEQLVVKQEVSGPPPVKAEPEPELAEPEPASALAQPRRELHHEQFGTVTVVRRNGDGTLTVRDSQFKLHRIQNPRGPDGNQLATFIRPAKEERPAEPPAPPAPSVVPPTPLPPTDYRKLSFPQQLARHELPTGGEEFYEAGNFFENLREKAQANIEQMGVKGAEHYISTAERWTDEHTATSTLLIKHLAALGDIEAANRIAEIASLRALESGRASAAADIGRLISPESALLTAQKIGRRAGNKVEPQLAEEVLTLAARVNSLEADLARLEREIKRRGIRTTSTGRAKRVPSTKEHWDTVEAEARARIAARKAKGEAGFIGIGRGRKAGPEGMPGGLDAFKDYVAIGAAKLARTGINFKAWTEEMIGELGETIRPWLPRIYRDSFKQYREDNKTLREQRARLGIQAGRAQEGVPEATEAEIQEILDQRADRRAQLTRDRQQLARIYNDLSGGESTFNNIRRMYDSPRELKTSFDLSATARQGGFFMPSHPKITANAFRSQLKSVASETGYNRVVDYIASHPRLGLAERAKLYLATRAEQLDPLSYAKREEFFPKSYAQEIPFLGKGIVASSRGYNAMLDVQRIDVFDRLAEQLEGWAAKHGRTPTKAEYGELADFINNGTGRAKISPFSKGIMGKIDSIMRVLPWWSPSFVKSRFNLLNPVYYATLPRGVRKIALQEAAKFYGTVGSLMTLGALMGARIVFDPDDPDFGQMRWGNTRIDISAGMRPQLRFIMKMGKHIGLSLWKGVLKGEQKEAVEQGKEVGRTAFTFFRSKTTPIPSTIIDLIAGQDFKGKPVTSRKVLENLFMPMVGQEYMEAYQTEGLGVASATLPLSLLGVGVQTYKESPKSAAFKRKKAAAERREKAIENLRKDPKDTAILDAAVEEGVMTPAQRKDIIQAAKLSPIEQEFKSKGLEEALIYYRQATPEQKKTLFPLLREKWSNAIGAPVRSKETGELGKRRTPTLPPAERARLQREYAPELRP